MTDLVVIGFGGAGAAAAIEAHDLGLDVLVLEKSEQGGGSTKESGGTLRLVADAEKSVEHYVSLSQGASPRSVFESYVAGLEELPTWLEKLGGRCVPYSSATYWSSVFPASYDTTAFPSHPGSEGLGSRFQATVPDRPEMRRGEALFELLERAATARGIEIVYSTSETRLLRGYGRVSAVEYTAGGRRHRVAAPAGVVLACGGFNYDPELQTQFFGRPLPALSPPGLATGDGIRMAQSVGADLWHMTGLAATFGFTIPGHEAGFWAQLPSTGFVLVDRHGRRYVNEAGVEKHAAGLAMLQIDPLTGDYPYAPSHLVFDETARLGGPVCVTDTGYNRGFAWARDNAEAVANGWFTTSDTIEGLAAQLGPAGANLEAEVAAFNAGCESAEDPMGRPAGSATPISTPPFYALNISACLLNTQGGPRRDAAARILDPARQPIPGLYGAGELGSIWNRLYPGAGNVSEALIYGRIAARTAAEETTA